jgi:hypothetical protein
MKITKISDTEEMVEVHGHTVRRNIGGIATQCQINGSSVVHLGQKVYANGRFGPADGTLGIVVGIDIPGENGRSTDIIEVWFEGEQSPLHMKTKDLQTERLAETTPA